jgi:hypothetical protein
MASGGIAAACSQGESWPGRSFRSPNSSDQDVGNSPYPSFLEAMSMDLDQDMVALPAEAPPWDCDGINVRIWENVS